jgi:arabinofuranosyltransferase
MGAGRRMGLTGDDADVLDARATAEAPPAEAEHEPAARAGWRRGVQTLLYAAPVVGFLGGGWANRWLTDDGFIYLRVVRQIRAGNGPVFNDGERVEAFTGTLWVALLAVADVVTPVRLEWIAVVLGLALGAAGVGLAMAGARRLVPEGFDDRWFVPCGAVVFVALTPVWVWATSGLETGLAFGWLGACLWVLASWSRCGARVSYPAAVLLGLGWLVRPDLALFSAAFVAVVLVGEWRQSALGRRAALVVAASALPVAYQIFRMGYFGSIVPNTAVAKEGGSTNFERGWLYLQDVVDPYWLWVPALALVVGAYLPLASVLTSLRGRLTTAAFVTCGVLHGAYVVAVGGDYMHARLLLPAVFALCAPVAVVPATRRHLAAIVIAPWAALAVVALRPLQYEEQLTNLTVLPERRGRVTTDDFGWGPDGPRRAWYVGPGVYGQQVFVGFSRVEIEVRRERDLPIGLFSGVGTVGYAMGPDFYILDGLGLGHTLAAHLEVQPLALRSVIPPLPGHEKPLPAPWMAALITPPGSMPDPSQFPPTGEHMLGPLPVDEFQEKVAWARAALQCGEIDRVLDAVGAPLTVKRFAFNLVHAVDNSQVRIPGDPEEAYRRFCGPGVPDEVRQLRAA